MDKANLWIALTSCLAFLFQFSESACAQQQFMKQPSPFAVKKLKAAVEAHPDSLKLHENFINAFSISDSRLNLQYDIWMKKFPKSAIVPFALGKTYEEYNDTVCKKYLRKAISINPNLAGAWAYLAGTAIFVGDNIAATKYMAEAVRADPKNAQYAFDYAFLFKDGDPVKYDSLMVNVAYRFPDNELGARVLSELAELPFNKNEKTAYYEALYSKYSKQQSDWYRAGMIYYYNYLINTAPNKAFDLALKMVLDMKKNRGNWKQKLIVARGFVDARAALNEGNPGMAEEIIDHINLGNSKVYGINIDAEETLALFKAEAAYANHKPQAAYDSLVAYYSKNPSDRMHRTLVDYALKLGVDSNKVDTDIWRIRDDAAWKPTNFTLYNYADGKRVSLSDYRGKVTLVTFWYPTCAPCNEELPCFEDVLKKFNNGGVAYLGINGNPNQNEYVMPTVKNRGYSFVPLRDDLSKTNGNLPFIQSYPTNFLIDQKGRVIFSDFRINAKNERMLELMISELLKFGSLEKNAATLQDAKNDKL